MDNNSTSGVLIIATGNPGKAREVAEILDGQALSRSVRVLTLGEVLGYMPSIEENGATLCENAWIKARAARTELEHYQNAMASACQNAIIAADDSGLFVDCLGGLPGVHSARYGGEGATSDAQIKKLLYEMRDIPDGAARSASFRCVITISFPGGAERAAEGRCDGIIATEPRGENGFGYDPIFYLPELGCTMAELASGEKNRISHRGIAVRRMADEIRLLLP